MITINNFFCHKIVALIFRIDYTAVLVTE